jgi:hypothetical protein
MVDSAKNLYYFNRESTPCEVILIFVAFPRMRHDLMMKSNIIVHVSKFLTVSFQPLFCIFLCDGPK